MAPFNIRVTFIQRWILSHSNWILSEVQFQPNEFHPIKSKFLLLNFSPYRLIFGFYPKRVIFLNSIWGGFSPDNGFLFTPAITSKNVIIWDEGKTLKSQVNLLNVIWTITVNEILRFGAIYLIIGILQGKLREM